MSRLIDKIDINLVKEEIVDIEEIKSNLNKRVVQNEEERFNQTLEQGLELLNSLIDTLAAEKATPAVEKAAKEVRNSAAETLRKLADTVEDKPKKK